MARKNSGRRCPACGTVVRPSQKYCQQCGAPLLPDAPPGDPPRSRRSLGKIAIGLVILLALARMLGAVIPDGSLVPKPELAADTGALPTRTSAPARPVSAQPLSTSTPILWLQHPVSTHLVISRTEADCAAYDAWEWAQSVYETDPVAFAALDPDGNGLACETLGHGFAPAFWTTGLPTGAVPATLAYIVDGDTYEILVNGQSARYRLYHADTPETYNTVQCGGDAATEFARLVLSYADTPGQVWIDGIDQRDKWGRKLAYIWFIANGQPYLLNHVLINNGWAEDIDYGDPYNPYREQLKRAAAFAREHQLGVWSLCGGFGIELANSAQGTGGNIAAQPASAAMGLAGNCDPNYTPCVPNVSYDLDCKDVGFRVQVIGYDRHGLDRDGDGIGCESY